MSPSDSSIFPRGLSAAAPAWLIRLVPALVAAFMGTVVLFGVGFAQPETIHDATHDARHATGFPCH